MSAPGHDLRGTSYAVIRELGSGGMGVVYEVEHVRLKKRYVAKVIHRDIEHEDTAARRLEREAKVLAAISHPNVVQVHDVGVTSDGVRYFIMEKLEGVDLRRMMKARSVSRARAVAIIADVLDALEHVHACGIVHRDVKPENVFIANGLQGTVTKVLDFGIAHVLDEDGRISRDRITKTGGFVGTLYYAAPEQMQGKPAGPANDVYAAALVLFELLAGKGPFDDDPGVGLSRCFKPAPPLTDFVPTAPKELADTLARALAQNPAERPTAGVLAAELRAVARAQITTEDDPVRAEVDDLLRRMATAGATVDTVTDVPATPRMPDAPGPVSVHKDAQDSASVASTVDDVPPPAQMSTSPGIYATVDRPPRSLRSPWTIAAIALVTFGAAGAVFVLKHGARHEAEPSSSPSSAAEAPPTEVTPPTPSPTVAAPTVAPPTVAAPAVVAPPATASVAQPVATTSKPAVRPTAARPSAPRPVGSNVEVDMDGRVRRF